MANLTAVRAPEVRMNTDIKARWVQALRSREFRQGRGALRSEIGHCCLGVLCEIAVQDGVVQRTERQPGRLPGYESSDGDRETGYLLPAVYKWAGLTNRNPYVDTPRGRVQLSQLNDSGNYDFAVIADLIEASL